MTNKSISQLTAGAAVSSTDIFPDVQTNGVGPVKVTAAQIGNYILGNQTNKYSANFVFDGSNLGLGVTPSAWQSGYKAFDFNTTGSVAAATNVVGVFTNAYVNSSSSYIYKTTNYATMYLQNAAGTGQHQWHIAPSGTAGNTITFTQAMTLDASGNLGIGTISPSFKIDLKNTSSTGIGGVIYRNDSTGQLLLGTFGSAASAYGSITANSSYIQGGSGRLVFQTADAFPITFDTAAVERMRIDSSGNVGIGETSPSTYGQLVVKGGSASATSPILALVANSFLGSDGPALDFHRAGFTQTVQARIRTEDDGTASSNLTFWTKNTGTAGTLTKRMILDNKGQMSLYYPTVTSSSNINEIFLSSVVDQASNTLGALNGITFRFNATPYTAGSLNRAAGIYGVNTDSAAGGVYARSAGLAFYTSAIDAAATEKMRIDSSGNVGIGTGSPGTILDIQNAVGAIRLQSTTGTNQTYMRYQNTGGFLYTGVDESAGGFLTGSAYAGYIWHTGAYPLIFATSNAPRMTLDASGNLLVGTTSAVGRLTVQGPTSGTTAVSITKPNGLSNAVVLNSGSTTTDPCILVQGNGTSTAYWLHNGDIYLPGGTAGVKTFSDIKLKRDVTYLDNQNVSGYRGLSEILQLKPVTYNFKSDSEDAIPRKGFVAQDFEQIFPELVSASKIPGDKAEVEYKHISDGGLIPVLVSAIQELAAKVQALEAKVQ